MVRPFSRKSALAMRACAIVAVCAGISAVAVLGMPADASPLTITPKPRVVDMKALSALQSLPTLSQQQGVSIAKAYGDDDEDCAVVGVARETVCKR